VIGGWWNLFHERALLQSPPFVDREDEGTLWHTQGEEVMRWESEMVCSPTLTLLMSLSSFPVVNDINSISVSPGLTNIGCILTISNGSFKDTS
jgi:hypothetical protein